jgi:hypothetical protein
MKIKLYILALISVVLISSCGSPTEPQAYLQSHKLKSETKWLCDPNSQTKLSKVSYKEYSAEGLLIKSIEFRDNGTPFTESEISYQDNQSIERVKYLGNGGSIDSTKITKYTYDQTGKTISLVESNPKGDTIQLKEFSYDKMGNLIRKVEKNRNSNNMLEVTFTNVYNQSGQIVERIQNLNIDGNYATKDSLIYLTNDKKIQKVTTDSKGEILGIYSYIFNSNGKIIIETKSDASGKIINYYKFEYLYY